MKISLLSLFTLLSLQSISQNLTGYWKGTISTESNGNSSGSVQQLEMNITQNGTVLDGCSHDYTLGRQDYCRASLKGTFDRSSNVVKTFGIAFLEKRAANGVDHVLFDSRLTYRKVGGKEMLVGRIVDENAGISEFFFSTTEKIVLYKVGPLPNPADKCYFEHLDGPVTKKTEKVVPKIVPPKTNPVVKENTSKKPPVVTPKKPPVTNPAIVQKKVVPKQKPVIVKKKDDTTVPVTIDSAKVVVKEPELPKNINNSIAQESAMRGNSVVKVIEVNVPVIKIELYDNGEIDGDTVSVIHNGEVIISHRMLTEKPITINLNVADGEDIHEITMFAHNLGRIPPNTALMIVTAGTQRYELRTSQDLKKNAVVIFEYKPDKQ